MQNVCCSPLKYRGNKQSFRGNKFSILADDDFLYIITSVYVRTTICCLVGRHQETSFNDVYACGYIHFRPNRGKFRTLRF